MKRTNLHKAVLLFALPLASALWLGGCAVQPIEAPPQQEKPVFPSPPDEARFFYEGSLYGSANVASDDPNGKLRRLLTGEDSGKTEVRLQKPYGVAVYHGRVYVSDTVARSVAVFDIPGQRFFKIGEDEPGLLTKPMGLDVDGKGNLYVADATSKYVQVYDRDGKFLRKLGGPTSLTRPTGVTVDAPGNRVYVVDIGGVSSQDHRVRVFDAQSGAHLLDIGKRGKGPGEFNFPLDASLGLNDLLYVVDSGNFRVQVFRTDGTFVRTFGSIGVQGGQFARPKEVATDPDGNVYVVDSAFGNFQIFNPDGQLLLAVGSQSETDAMAKYKLPAGIAIDGDGRVYVVDQWFRKVDIYRPAKLAEDAGFIGKKKTTEGKK